MRKLSVSVIRENKALSIALLVMYTMIVALLVMLIFFADSFDATIGTYFGEYDVFDLCAVTYGTNNSIREEIESIDGVEAVSMRLFSNVVVELDDGTRVTMGAFFQGNNSRWKSFDPIEECNIQPKEDSVMVSAFFAERNDISKGSDIKIKTVSGYKSYTVTDIISNPETIGVGLTFASWYDLTDYGYIYFSDNLCSEIIGFSGCSNNIRILLSDDADIDAVKTEIIAVLGEENIKSLDEYEGSVVDNQISQSVDGARALTTYLPAVISAIGLLFAVVFMCQIVRKSFRSIGLLRALGYSKADVRNVFVLYSLFISAVATVLGIIIGALLLGVIMNIYKSYYYLPYVCYDGSIPSVLAAVIGVNLLSCAAVLISSGEISKIEPAAAFGGEENADDGTIPAALEKIKCNPFNKLAIGMIYRNRGRVLVTALCMLACMLLTMLALAVVITKNEALDYTFNERFSLDFVVFADESNDIQQMSRMDNLENVITGYQYDIMYDGEATRLQSADWADDASSIILEEGFARRHSLKIGDYIEIKGQSFLVQDITRQYLCSTQYLSPEAFQNLGYEENALAADLGAEMSWSDLTAAVSEYDSFLQALNYSHIRACAEETMNQLDIPCYIFTVFAMLMGFIIIYNMSLISFSKRKREFATLRAIGTENSRILSMLFTEAITEFIPSCLLAPLGFLVIKAIFLNISSSAEEYVLVHHGCVLAVSCVLTLIYMSAGVFGTYSAVKKMDIVLELNKRE